MLQRAGNFDCANETDVLKQAVMGGGLVGGSIALVGGRKGNFVAPELLHVEALGVPHVRLQPDVFHPPPAVLTHERCVARLPTVFPWRPSLADVRSRLRHLIDVDLAVLERQPLRVVRRVPPAHVIRQHLMHQHVRLGGRDVIVKLFDFPNPGGNVVDDWNAGWQRILLTFPRIKLQPIVLLHLTAASLMAASSNSSRLRFTVLWSFRQIEEETQN